MLITRISFFLLCCPLCFTCCPSFVLFSLLSISTQHPTPQTFDPAHVQPRTANATQMEAGSHFASAATLISSAVTRKRSRAGSQTMGAYFHRVSPSDLGARNRVAQAQFEPSTSLPPHNFSPSLAQVEPQPRTSSASAQHKFSPRTSSDLERRPHGYRGCARGEK